jgi:cytosine deaminase
MERQDEAYLKAALAEAKKGLQTGGIPIGSVLVHQGAIIEIGRASCRERVSTSV